MAHVRRNDDSTSPASPLEEFVRDYVEVGGGVWDEVEPQVYDVLLPADEGRAGRDAEPAGPAHRLRPRSPARSTPALSWPASARRWSTGCLADAMQRGRYARVYLERPEPRPARPGRPRSPRR